MSPLEEQNASKYLCSLALLYHRHGASERALLFGLAAAKLGVWTPSLALTLGSLFLRLGEPDQAQAVLSRFQDDGELLDGNPTQTETLHALKLMARTALRLGNKEKAQDYTSRIKQFVDKQHSISA